VWRDPDGEELVMVTRINPRLLILLLLLLTIATSVVQAGECGGDWNATVAAPAAVTTTSVGMFDSDAAERLLTVRLPAVSRYSHSLQPDSVMIPNGRPIYALFVHGYSQNENLNLVLCYKFAKRLMQDGAYIHHAWWNNLCAEYMARPLHSEQAYPGHAGLWGMWDGAFEPAHKAFPADDYQFQADAGLLLEAIRENNPNAVIIVVGHSMGGGAVARLGTNTDVVIDILAPLDPVENRSTPWVAWNPVAYNPWHNWTRYRIARADLVSWPPPDPAPQRRIRSNVINLFHRYQMESAFPMDYLYEEHFLHDAPAAGSSSQVSIATCKSALHCFGECCNGDGHGEIVGYRGLTINLESNAWGLQMRGGWPTGRAIEDVCERKRLLMELPHADYLNDWEYRPLDPELCMVSDSLIELYEGLNLPPTADAGGDRVVAYSLDGVSLDASASSDPDPADELDYTWQADDWQAEGPTVTAQLEPGTHAVTLTVADPAGHIDRDVIQVTVVMLESASQGVAGSVQVHPNPFNSAVRLSFVLVERQHVVLEVFDLQGRLVRTLENNMMGPGPHERSWGGQDDSGRVVSSGCYIVRMQAGDQVEMSKVSLVK